MKIYSVDFQSEFSVPAVDLKRLMTTHISPLDQDYWVAQKIAFRLIEQMDFNRGYMFYKESVAAVSMCPNAVAILIAQDRQKLIVERHNTTEAKDSLLFNFIDEHKQDSRLECLVEEFIMDRFDVFYGTMFQREINLNVG